MCSSPIPPCCVDVQVFANEVVGALHARLILEGSRAGRLSRLRRNLRVRDTR